MKISTMVMLLWRYIHEFKKLCKMCTFSFVIDDITSYLHIHEYVHIHGIRTTKTTLLKYWQFYFLFFWLDHPTTRQKLNHYHIAEYVERQKKNCILIHFIYIMFIIYPYVGLTNILNDIMVFKTYYNFFPYRKIIMIKLQYNLYIYLLFF